MTQELPRFVAILLVEDSPSDAELLKEMLWECSSGRYSDKYQVTVAETWKAATDLLKERRFDVMLLDLGLPDSNGEETFIRARKQAAQLPIIVMTEGAYQTFGLGALRLGIQDYLIKGHADGLQVARSIRHAMERKSIEDQLRAARDELETRVRERTAELYQSVAELRAEARRRLTAEEALRESEARYRTLYEVAPVGIAISTYQGKVVAVNPRVCEMTGVSPEEFRARPARQFYVEPAQRRKLVAEVTRTGQVEEREVLLRRSDGSAFPALLHMGNLQVGGRELLMTIVQDITRQKQTEWHVEGVRDLLELFATKKTRSEYVGGVVKLLRDRCGCRCAGIRLPDDHGLMKLARAVGYSRQFLKEETCLRSAGGDCPCYRVFEGQPREGDAEFTGAKGSFFCNRTLAYAGRLWKTVEGRGQAACLRSGYNSLAQAPILHHGELLGTIHLADLRPGRFPPETIEFIETIAPMVGEALHRFRVEESFLASEERFRTMFYRHAAVMLLIEPQTGALVDANPAAVAFYGYPLETLRRMNIGDLNLLPPAVVAEERRRAALRKQNCFLFPHRLANGQVRTVEVHSTRIEVEGRKLLFSIIHDVTERRLQEREVLDVGERERQRVGQELHDSLGSKLTGVALMGQALARKLAELAPGEAKLAGEMVHCVNEVIRETRAIAHGLCPAELRVSGLGGALVELAGETRLRSGKACRVELDEAVKIEDAFLATHLYRIAQEAVTNAIRHAAGREIRIRLRKTARDYLLEIADDGIGLEGAKNTRLGLGLHTMKHRAAVLGAELTIQARKGGGTVVACRLPQRAVRNVNP